MNDELRRIAGRTPRSWGKQIIERNEALLEALHEIYPKALESQKSQSRQIRIGCPHCQHAQGACSQCAFGEIEPWVITPCQDVEFAGMLACWLVEQAVGLQYFAEFATIWVWPKGLYRETLDEEKDQVERFLQAHIEWGHLIQKIGVDE